jgi:hypothetical protein
VVADGFVGNIVLKTAESLGYAMKDILKSGLTANPLRKFGALLARGGQASVVEPMITGRFIEVAVLGNVPARCLPPVEVLPGGKDRAAPAVLDAGLGAATRAAALAACRDYAVIVMCIKAGQPVVLEVETAGVLAGQGLRTGSCGSGADFRRSGQPHVEVARPLPSGAGADERHRSAGTRHRRWQQRRQLLAR